MPGFPIRTSADHGLVDGSPQLFAVTHVLHRSLAPRHPPLALSSLEKITTNSRKNKMLVLALQFSRCDDQRMRSTNALDTAAHEEGSTPSKRKRRREIVESTRRREENLRPLPIAGDDPPVHQLGVAVSAVAMPRRAARLLRKEVIQPHLPVRLPCYDFTPITDPTFDGSLPEGWATGFGCCRLSLCDGRCVQGPGTYSPRRADPGLLATPASWSRVADSNPN